MKTQKKELVQQLLESLGPQLSSVVPADQKPAKGLLKTVHHLADQLLRLRAKQEKRAAKAATLVPKEAKQKLTDELAAVLDAHFAGDALEGKTNELLTETAEELAGKITKLRNKQAKKKAPQPAAEQLAADTTESAPARSTRRPKKGTPAVADASAS